MSYTAVRSAIVLACIVVMPATAQRLELPLFTAEQRWDRASKNVTLFAVVYTHATMKAGKSAAQAGVELAGFFGPWSAVATPADMARTIHRNWQLWRDVDFVALESADGSIIVTANRPYVPAIQQYNAIGVSPADFDAMFGAFHQAIAQQQGLDFRQMVDKASVRMEIRRVK